MWDEQLIGFGSTMIKWRSEFVRRLAVTASPIHSELTDGEENLEIGYEPSFPIEGQETAEGIKPLFRQALANARAQELARATTVRGPHRDDISFQIGGMEHPILRISGPAAHRGVGDKTCRSPARGGYGR